MAVIEESFVRLLDRVENRYLGKYTGFVSDNSDPENRGRLRVKVPSVLGPDVISGWALPCAPFGGQAGQGFFFVPEVGAGVWVEFEGGDPDYPIWVGTFWSKPGGSTEVPAPAASESPPTTKIIATKKHVVEFADADNQEAIKITDVTNKNTVVLDSNGIAIKDQNGNQIVLAKSGIDIKDQNGNEIALTSDGTTVTSSVIKLGQAAAQSMVLGTMLKSLLDPFFKLVAAHTHPTAALGPPSVPTPPLVPPVLDGALSQKHKVE
jgi:uncharacterized protein involved in type VI secretion and phage assembly